MIFIATKIATARATRLVAKLIYTLLVIPAVINPTKEAEATVKEYGIWVETWEMWSQPEPAEDKIVVSEIGEQWSPKTEPEKIAPKIKGKYSSSFIFIIIGTKIGKSIPKVPQAVPVEKARKPATIKTIDGKKVNEILCFFIKLPINSPVFR